MIVILMILIMMTVISMAKNFEMGLMTAIAMVKNNIHNSERNIDDVDRDYNNDRDDDLRNSDYVYDDITYISIQGRHQNQFSQW